MISEKMMLY